MIAPFRFSQHNKNTVIQFITNANHKPKAILAPKVYDSMTSMQTRFPSSKAMWYEPRTFGQSFDAKMWSEQANSDMDLAICDSELHKLTISAPDLPAPTSLELASIMSRAQKATHSVLPQKLIVEKGSAAESQHSSATVPKSSKCDSVPCSPIPFAPMPPPMEFPFSSDESDPLASRSQSSDACLMSYRLRRNFLIGLENHNEVMRSQST